MRYLLLPFIILYRIYFAVVFFAVLTILYPLFWLMLLNDKNFDKVFKIKVATSRIILFLVFIYLKRIEMPKDLKGPFVVCSNHCSYLDIIQMYSILPRTKFMMIGKSELLKWPIISIFIRKMDIDVDRKKPHSAMRSINRAKNELSKGWAIAIYPEGKIPDNAPVLNPFKSGAFKMAIEEQVPILPITLIDTWKLFGTDPMLTASARPGISRIVVHEPISTKGLEKKDLVNLRQQTFDTINAPLLKYNKERIDKG